MAAKSSTYETALLKLVFQAVNFANIADNTATSPNTNLYVSLHTATLTAASTQVSSEAAYGAYARVAVARTSGGWTVTGGSVSPAATIIFPTATNAGTTASGGTETETYMGVGLAASGAGNLLYWGPISPSIVVALGGIPELTTSSTLTES